LAECAIARFPEITGQFEILGEIPRPAGENAGRRDDALE
jgi:hypothetical protein